MLEWGARVVAGGVVFQAEGVGVRYGARRALEGVDLVVERGDVLGVVGPNGGGKTTLLRVMAGVLEPTEGRVRYGEPVPRIGYVPQRLHFDLTFPMTVGEFLTLQVRERGVWLGGVSRKWREEIERCLGRFGARGLVGRRLGELSGGELQRVMAAAALLQEPELLLLDEPAASIDPVGAAKLGAELLELREETGCTIVFVSHDLHFIGRVARRVLCLNGSVCALGRPEQVLNEHHLSATFGGRGEGNDGEDRGEEGGSAGKGAGVRCARGEGRGRGRSVEEGESGKNA